jgi:hypothetical protein
MSSAVLRERRCCISIEAAKGNYIQTNQLSELVLNVKTCVHDFCCLDDALIIHNAGSTFTKVQLLASTVFADDEGSCVQLPNKDTKDQNCSHGANKVTANIELMLCTCLVIR